MIQIKDPSIDTAPPPPQWPEREDILLSYSNTRSNYNDGPVQCLCLYLPIKTRSDGAI